jgi:hypothetical protein
MLVSWRGAFWVCSVLALLAGVGCGEKLKEPPPWPEPPPLVSYPGEWNGDGDLISGTLVIRSQCVYIETAGGARWLAAFAVDGTGWDGDTLSIYSKRFRVGEPIELPGSRLSLDWQTVDWPTPPRDHCNKERIWLSGIP